MLTLDAYSGDTQIPEVIQCSWVIRDSLIMVVAEV